MEYARASTSSSDSLRSSGTSSLMLALINSVSRSRLFRASSEPAPPDAAFNTSAFFSSMSFIPTRLATACAAAVSRLKLSGYTRRSTTHLRESDLRAERVLTKMRRAGTTNLRSIQKPGTVAVSARNMDVNASFNSFGFPLGSSALNE